MIRSFFLSCLIVFKALQFYPVLLLTCEPSGCLETTSSGSFRAHPVMIRKTRSRRDETTSFFIAFIGYLIRLKRVNYILKEGPSLPAD
jgi:hypothetical protein